jgi:hypothetical protein
MARIRTIKPEFWQDEKLSVLRPVDRLVFLGLISMADDAGRLPDSLKHIDGFVFPNTEESSRESIETLETLKRVLRYEASNGQACIQIVNWHKHQKVDNPAKYTLPAPNPKQWAKVRSSRESREVQATVSESPIDSRSGSRSGSPRGVLFPRVRSL